MKNLYFNWTALYVGLYIGKEHYYFVPLPGVVIRKERKLKCWTKIYGEGWKHCENCNRLAASYHKKESTIYCDRCYYEKTKVSY